MEKAYSTSFWKMQVAVALMGALFLEAFISGWQVLSNRIFLSGFILKVIYMLILFEAAKAIFKITEKYFIWHSNNMARIIISIFLASLTSVLVVFTLNLLQGHIFEETTPLIESLSIDTLISILILLIILSGITIRSFLQQHNDNILLASKQDNQEFFKDIIKELEDIIQVVDKNGKVLFTNVAIFHLLGFKPEDAHGVDAFQFIHPEDKKRVASQFSELIQQGPSRDYEVEYRLITKEGSVKHVATRVVNALSNSNINGFIAMVRDITHRKEDEQALKQSLSVNKGIIESTAEGILVTDLKDNIIQYNEAFKEMWLLSNEMLKEGKKSVALNYAIQNVVNAEEVYKIVSTSDENVNERISLIAFLKNGRVLEGISMPQRIDGKVVGRVWSNRDITDRVNSEKEEIEKGVAQAQFESLKNQVNPHFLFNSLNVLSSLVHLSADLSEKFIDQLAKSYRYLLEQKDNELVPLKTEIDFVNSFTFLLKIRFEEKLQIRINLSAKTMNDYIAPLTLQLLIENAVKHNVISTEAPLLIDIHADGQGDYLIVSNNLQLRAQQIPSTNVGLKNITSRYKLLTRKEPEFKVVNQNYVARIPLIKSE